MYCHRTCICVSMNGSIYTFRLAQGKLKGPGEGAKELSLIPPPILNALLIKSGTGCSSSSFAMCPNWQRIGTKHLGTGEARVIKREHSIMTKLHKTDLTKSLIYLFLLTDKIKISPTI